MEIPDFLVPTGDTAVGNEQPIYREFLTLPEAISFAKELCKQRREPVPILAPIRVIRPRIECDIEERNNFRNAPDA